MGDIVQHTCTKTEQVKMKIIVKKKKNLTGFNDTSPLTRLLFAFNNRNSTRQEVVEDHDRLRPKFQFYLKH